MKVRWLYLVHKTPYIASYVVIHKSFIHDIYFYFGHLKHCNNCLSSVVLIVLTTYYMYIVLRKLEADQELREAVMKSLVSKPRIPTSLAKQPSDKAMNMTTEELCQWLKVKLIPAEYIECFERLGIDGSDLADYNEEDLKKLGVSESHIRKRIMNQFRKI